MIRKIALVVLTAAMVAGAQTSKPAGRAEAEQKPPAESDVRNTLERLYAAWSDLDPAKAARFYDKDPSLVFFDVAPMKYAGWSEYAAGVPTAFAAYRSGKFTLKEDLRVHQHGNLAWATATWTGDLSKKDGSKEHVEGRYTAVLEKRGRDWLVLHEHMSVPMGATPQASASAAGR